MANVRSKFWIIVNDKFPTTVSVKHQCLQNAETEAGRLARAHRGEEFIIMQSVVSYKVDDLVVTNFVESYDNPDSLNYIPF